MAHVIDIFSGIGGLTHGFALEGFTVLAGIDCDDSCRYAYEANNVGSRFIHAKLEDINPKNIASLYPKDSVKVLVGCAPCQPFSSHTNKIRNKNDQWRLVGEFAELILAVKPDIISMENVSRLKSFNNGTIFNDFTKKLSNDYCIFSTEVNCADYGVPQSRNRLVVLGSRYGKIELLEPTHTPPNHKTVRSVIGNLPPISAGEVSDVDPLHRSHGLSEINLARIIQSKPGGTWLDWDDELRAACHRKASGQSYKSVYGRMSWDQPSPTITTQSYIYGTGRFGHPEQNRALSLREMALIQTFPINYQFIDPHQNRYPFRQVGLHIGNAVPVQLARVIARSIAKHLENYNVS
jgi:DNA (cytosine-5)-methyltransferase 1